MQLHPEDLGRTVRYTGPDHQIAYGADQETTYTLTGRLVGYHYRRIRTVTGEITRLTINIAGIDVDVLATGTLEFSEDAQ